MLDPKGGGGGGGGGRDRDPDKCRRVMNPNKEKSSFIGGRAKSNPEVRRGPFNGVKNLNNFLHKQTNYFSHLFIYKIGPQLI